ncbi:MAG: hypothetical protein C4317_10005, partial [Acidimicrobiia bacterium]
MRFPGLPIGIGSEHWPWHSTRCIWDWDAWSVWKTKACPQLAVVERHAREYDFVYFHFKATDAAGEDGDFQRKCAAIEMVDAEVIPRIERSWTGVIVVTGDHSTPTQMASHSWH